MNLMLLLAQVAPALADSIAGANPVLTPVAAPDEMNLWSMAVKGGWIMVVLGVLSVVCFYILFERNYVIRKAGKEDPMMTRWTYGAPRISSWCKICPPSPAGPIPTNWPICWKRPEPSLSSKLPL